MEISKLIFVNWSPSEAPIKNRVLYATAKESFKKYLDMNTKDYTLDNKNDVLIRVLSCLRKSSGRSSGSDAIL